MKYKLKRKHLIATLAMTIAAVLVAYYVAFMATYQVAQGMRSMGPGPPLRNTLLTFTSGTVDEQIAKRNFFLPLVVIYERYDYVFVEVEPGVRADGPTLIEFHYQTITN
jgi:hypothetical protein